ncbi:hypothetical protein LZ30DRAFT_416655 [Colletotrichum cereale]|nr:hypothetical protein LZ30DRAFT_416655 [Colletotrichum cereale]
MCSAAGCSDPSTLAIFNSLSGLPSNASTGFVVVGRKRSHGAMVACCLPYAVSIASDCYHWCELPTDGLDGFASGLVRHGMEKGIVGLNTSGAVGTTTGRKLVGFVVWVPFFANALHL